MEQGATLTFTSWRSRTPRGPSKRGFTRVPCSSSRLCQQPSGGPAWPPRASPQVSRGAWSGGASPHMRVWLAGWLPGSAHDGWMNGCSGPMKLLA